MASLFGLHVDVVTLQKKIGERYVIDLLKILYFKTFFFNLGLEGKFYTRQTGEWLKIHTRQSIISLAIASVASVISTPGLGLLNGKS